MRHISNDLTKALRKFWPKDEQAQIFYDLRPAKETVEFYVFFIHKGKDLRLDYEVPWNELFDENGWKGELAGTHAVTVGLLVATNNMNDPDWWKEFEERNGK